LKTVEERQTAPLCHPDDQKEAASGNGQHNERPEMMIVSVLAQTINFS
jgi:hypothetical protein